MGGLWRGMVANATGHVARMPFWDNMLCGPGIHALGFRRRPTGPNALRWTEAALKPFLEAGLAKRGVAYAAHAIHVYIFGFALFRSSPLSAMETGGKSKAEVLAATRKKFQGLSPTQFANIVLLAEALTNTDIEARFLFALDCLVAGIAQRARTKPRRIPSSR
jgi:hypothetical protein